MAKDKPVTALFIGAGSRASVYAQYHKEEPDKFQIVGVAEPREFYRNKFVQQFNISEDTCFTDWKAAAELDKFADCVIIATPDQIHCEPAIAFSDKKYDILLEKPMAPTAEECRRISETCKRNGTLFAVGHVLRYSRQARFVKHLIMRGSVGQVYNIQLMEPVGFWHFAHSFVRGNWRKESESGFALLTKSCHDIDLLCWWMRPAKCLRVSSFGALTHFREENKPEGASSRCTDCKVERECPYSAVRLYVDNMAMQGRRGWPVDVVAEVPDIENVMEALRTGPYGRCVFFCDNDVLSNQVVNMEFEGGRTASFSMVAFTKMGRGRQLVVNGSHGEISCDLSGDVQLFTFLGEKTEIFKVATMDKMVADWEQSGETKSTEEIKQTKMWRHGGSDYHMFRAFVRAVAEKDASLIDTGPDDTLQSHLVTFAAERSRRENRVIEL